jgi:hypothetical protein
MLEQMIGGYPEEYGPRTYAAEEIARERSEGRSKGD